MAAPVPVKSKRGSAIAPTKLPKPPARIVPGTGGRPIRVAGKAARDPRFQKVMMSVEKSSSVVKSHPTPVTKAYQAQTAAKAAPKEQAAGAQAAKVDDLKDAKTEKPKDDSFLALLREEIEKVMPKTNDDAGKFMEGGEKEQLKGAVTGNVNQQKDQATGPLKATSETPPDPSAVPAKEEQPIPADPAAPAPPVNAGEAMPAPAPTATIQAKADDSKKSADQQMKDAEINDTQMQKANDPRFSAVVSKKDNVNKVATEGVNTYKTGEAKVLTQSIAQSQDAGKQGLMQFTLTKGKGNSAVRAKQDAAKARDEARRKEVTTTIESIFNKTKTKVDGLLSTLEADVTRLFDSGSEAAINKMKEVSQREIDDFKDDRYSGLSGKLLWVKDQFSEARPEIKDILARNRKVFTVDMDAMVVRIANLVEQRLAQAKAEIDRGQAEIKTYVTSLPRDLQSVGQAAQAEMQGRFDELRQGVDAKKEQLAQKLAERYKSASDGADAEVKKMEAANAGALAGLIAAIREVIKVLTEFKDKVLALLRKAASAIKLIIADPIGFLKNLLSAIKGGLSKFIANIWTHLKKAFMEWLFGSLAEAGIEMPQDLSLPSILKLVLGVLGITYDKMRAKAVKLIGERNVKIIEKVVDYVKTLITGGPAALWEKVKEDLGNLKQMVIDALQNWLIETLVKKAIAKIVSMFNPVGALIQAILTIYDVVVFVVEKAKQIFAFVEAIVDSIYNIATGSLGAAIDYIENALARMLPLLISFLAQFIGLGGVSKKIKEFILKIQTTVDKAIDKAIAKIVDVVKKLFGKGKDSKDDKADDDQSKAVKDKVKNALKGKSIANVEEAQSLESGIYTQFQPQGLKGIRIIPDPKKHHEVGIKVSASAAEIVANLPLKNYEDLIKIFSFVDNFSAEVGTTRLYVFYDADDKPFTTAEEDEPITNSHEGHAETKFLKNIHLLKAKIALDRSNGKIKTSANRPIKVELNLNRLPCSGCAENLAKAASANPDLKFIVKASSVWKIGGLHAATSAEDIKKMIDAGIKVEALDIWKHFAKRLREFGSKVKAKKIRISSTSRVNTIISIINVDGPRLKTAAAEVQSLIDDAAKLVSAKKKTEGDITKVPPKGSGV